MSEMRKHLRFTIRMAELEREEIERERRDA
jgi:hypothetical protein